MPFSGLCFPNGSRTGSGILPALSLRILIAAPADRILDLSAIVL